MRRVVVAAPGRVEVTEVAEPALEPESVLVEVAACGVCGSDLPAYRGQQPFETLPSFGHEFSGTVLAAGEVVTDLRPGDRVASGVTRTCGRCAACLGGHPNYCADLQDVFAPGGFAQRTRVRHGPASSSLARVADGLAPEHAALHEPLSCAVRIAERGVPRPGDRVLVLGLGAMGLLAGLLTGLWGAGTVVGVDVSAGRLGVAGRAGIAPVDRGAEDWRERVDAALGAPGADLVLETTGRPSGFADALALARLGGRVVVGSVYHEPASDLDLRPIMRKELRVVGAKGPFPRRTGASASLAMEVLASGRLPLDGLVQVYSLERADEAFRAADAATVFKPIVRFDVAW